MNVKLNNVLSSHEYDFVVGKHNKNISISMNCYNIKFTISNLDLRKRIDKI